MSQMKRIIWIIILLFIVLFFGANESPKVTGLENTSAALVSSITENNPLTEAPIPELKVYFLDVGQGDSALVVCDGMTMLIDGGSTEKSAYLYSFLKTCNITHLDYIVATHSHEDHVGGLSGALNFATVGIALCPVTEYNSKAFGNFKKYLKKQNVSITIPKPGDTFKLGSADVIVVGPVNPSENPNDTSIVIKVTFGKTGFLFTGDAERSEEQDILGMDYDLFATVLKAGHHGSDTSTTYPFLREIMPQYAVISCGKDNVYGHPHENMLSRLRDADVTLYRTDMQGTITCTSDGSTISFITERNAAAQTNPANPVKEEAFYIGNTNTHKFHRPDCEGLPAEKNRIIIDTRGAALSAGYSPCAICKP